MEGMSVWHWVILLLVAAFTVLPVFPIAEILRKAGYRRAWALVWFIPYGNIVAFVIFAYAKWPVLRVDEKAADKTEA